MSYSRVIQELFKVPFSQQNITYRLSEKKLKLKNELKLKLIFLDTLYFALLDLF